MINNKALFLILTLLPSYALAAITPSEKTAVPSTQPPVIDEQLRQFIKDHVDAAGSFTDRFDAEAWLMLMSGKLKRYVKDPDERLDLLRQIHHEAAAAGVKPALVLAVIETESHFNRFAISRVGAQGMMQIMPFWKHEIGRPEDNLTEVTTNLRYGCIILKHYMDRSNNKIAEALARYNGSYGSYKYSAKVMDAWARWR